LGADRGHDDEVGAVVGGDRLHGRCEVGSEHCLDCGAGTVALCLAGEVGVGGVGADVADLAVEGDGEPGHWLFLQSLCLAVRYRRRREQHERVKVLGDLDDRGELRERGDGRPSQIVAPADHADSQRAAATWARLRSSTGDAGSRCGGVAA
jgi:hypothetical protein